MSHPPFSKTRGKETIVLPAYSFSVKADVERSSLLGVENSAVTDEKKSELVKAAFYGLRVFYTFFIM